MNYWQLYNLAVLVKHKLVISDTIWTISFNNFIFLHCHLVAMGEIFRAHQADSLQPNSPPQPEHRRSVNLAFIVKNKSQNVDDNSVLSDTFTECHLTVCTHVPPSYCTTFETDRITTLNKGEQHCPIASAIVSPSWINKLKMKKEKRKKKKTDNSTHTMQRCPLMGVMWCALAGLIKAVLISIQVLPWLITSAGYYVKYGVLIAFLCGIHGGTVQDSE